MRPPWLTCAFLAACGGGAGGGTTTPVNEPIAGGELADEDRFVPTYGKADLSRALIAERGAEAAAERQVQEIEALVAAGSTPAGTDRLRVALVDLAVRRRFIATLEACEQAGRFCPPRLDDPPFSFDPASDVGTPVPLDAAMRFDLDSWRAIAAELHGRACGCRTMGCIDSMGVAIDQLETRPMQAVQGDEAATLSITRARECLFRLRGKKPFRVAAPEI